MQTPRRPPTTGRQLQAEHRAPAVVAVLIALTLYVTLPSTFYPVFRYVVAAIALAILVPVIALNPRRMNRETRWSK